MATETCSFCQSTYDPDQVSIPEALPDLMCFHCGSTVTPEQAEALAPEDFFTA
jgi:recombinational DNA repair protein (RecF pathway)